MGQSRVRIPLQTQITTLFCFPYLLNVARPVIDRWAGILTFMGSLIRASHALGSTRKVIIGVFHTLMWSLGFPRAFCDSVPVQVLTVPALQLNSGKGD